MAREVLGDRGQAGSERGSVRPFACVVLAAGAGSRFGGPKADALLPSGERFLDAVTRAAAAAGAEPVIAVVRPGTPPPARGRAVVTASARGEQIASARLGLAQLAGTRVRAALLWPVDHPFVLIESAVAVADAHARTGAPIVVPTYAGQRGHPVMFDRGMWLDLMTVESGGARAVVRAYGPRVHEVPVPDAGVIQDIDTPTDMPGGG
ncbi:MAG: NTP transferase domain-containing protein [Gemmatimonadaceae bacterium]